MALQLEEKTKTDLNGVGPSGGALEYCYDHPAASLLRLKRHGTAHMLANHREVVCGYSKYDYSSFRTQNDAHNGRSIDPPSFGRPLTSHQLADKNQSKIL